jgi:hypothetical protein
MTVDIVQLTSSDYCIAILATNARTHNLWHDYLVIFVRHADEGSLKLKDQ